MALGSLRRRTFTPEEYLTLERQADYKSEYVNGDIYAMAGGSPAHNQISANVIGGLWAIVKDLPCRVMSSDMKVRSANKRAYFYPDATLTCGEMRFDDEHKDVLLNPTVIIEVLSPSTGEYDRSTKRSAYASLESVKDILFVYQDEARVEHHGRTEDGSWLLKEAAGLEGEVRLRTHNLALPLSEIYHKVDFAVI